jgi:hypothetical protein
MEAILAPSGIGGAEIILRPKLMEVVKTLRLIVVLRGVEPAPDGNELLFPL